MKIGTLFFIFFFACANTFNAQSIQKADTQTDIQNINFNFVYTGVKTGYDYQSNGTPQQIWQDPNNPFNVHAVFIHSNQNTSWSDRNGIYFFSSDMGQSWNNMGNIQVGTSARGGFPSISGLNNGRPVAALNTNDSTILTRTQIYVRDLQGSEWLRYDPGISATTEPLYPRILGVGNDQVFVAALSDGICTNSLNISTGDFSGWNCSNVNAFPESYKLAKSDNESTLGLTFIGGREDSLTFGNVYYIESLDGGIIWSDLLTVYQYDYEGDSLGAFRGIDMIFLDNEPYIVFEVVKQDFAGQTYNDTLPNKIMFWSPVLNNGICFPLAESGVNIPFYINYSSYFDQFLPVCRPAIGKSADGNALFVVMNVVTEHYLNWYTEISYFAGYLTYSLNGGINWSTPLKFTPETPLKDWRYISISPTNAVSVGDCILQMSAQADTIPGFYPVISWPQELAAEFVGVTSAVPLVGINDTKKIPDKFELSQNYPNPFNPSTTINYNVAAGSDINLSVYNLLGEKITELVNEYKEPGRYEVKLNLENYTSGVYFYKIKAGDFIQIKKMTLIK